MLLASILNGLLHDLDKHVFIGEVALFCPIGLTLCRHYVHLLCRTVARHCSSNAWYLVQHCPRSTSNKVVITWIIQHNVWLLRPPVIPSHVADLKNQTEQTNHDSNLGQTHEIALHGTIGETWQPTYDIDRRSAAAGYLLIGDRTNNQTQHTGLNEAPDSYTHPQCQRQHLVSSKEKILNTILTLHPMVRNTNTTCHGVGHVHGNAVPPKAVHAAGRIQICPTFQTDPQNALCGTPW